MSCENIAPSFQIWKKIFWYYRGCDTHIYGGRSYIFLRTHTHFVVLGSPRGGGFMPAPSFTPPPPPHRPPSPLLPSSPHGVDPPHPLTIPPPLHPPTIKTTTTTIPKTATTNRATRPSSERTTYQSTNGPPLSLSREWWSAVPSPENVAPKYPPRQGKDRAQNAG